MIPGIDFIQCAHQIICFRVEESPKIGSPGASVHVSAEPAGATKKNDNDYGSWESVS